MEQQRLLYDRWKQKRVELLQICKSNSAKFREEEQTGLEKSLVEAKREMANLKIHGQRLEQKTRKEQIRLKGLSRPGFDAVGDSGQKTNSYNTLDRATQRQLNNFEKLKGREAENRTKERERLRQGREREEDARLLAQKVSEANKEKLRIRGEIDQIKEEERRRFLEEEEEVQNAARKRMERLLDKLKVEAPDDPGRLTRLLEKDTSVAAYVDPMIRICRGDVREIRGYTEEKLRTDKRYRLSAALAEHKLAPTTCEAAREKLCKIGPVLHDRHALKSTLPMAAQMHRTTGVF